VTLDHAAGKFIPKRTTDMLKEIGRNDKTSRRIVVEGEISKSDATEQTAFTRTSRCLNDSILEETGALIARDSKLRNLTDKEWEHVGECIRCLNVVIRSKQEHEDNITEGRI
jgi:hypothetical protein